MIITVQVSALKPSGWDRKPREHGSGKGCGGCCRFITHKVP